MVPQTEGGLRSRRNQLSKQCYTGIKDPMNIHTLARTSMLMPWAMVMSHGHTALGRI